MSQENVDKARAFIAAYNRSDFDTAVRDFDLEIEWVMPARQRSDSGRGPGAALRFFDEIDETLEELWLEPQELYHQVATFRDGRIVRMEYFAEWTEALRAAGLSA